MQLNELALAACALANMGPGSTVVVREQPEEKYALVFVHRTPKAPVCTTAHRGHGAQTYARALNQARRHRSALRGAGKTQSNKARRNMVQKGPR